MNKNKMLKRSMTDKGENIAVILSDNSTRYLGIIRDGVFYTQRDPNKHLFHKTNSYGFNWDLLSTLPEDTKILVEEKGYKYYLKTTAGEVMKANDYKYFKSQNLELQVFLNRDKFGLEIKKKF